MIHSIGLVVHEGKRVAIEAAGAVRDWAGLHGLRCTDLDVWTVSDDAGRLTAAEEAAKAGRPDLIVTVGGDGTFLRGARVAAAVDAAVLGVDVGRVGFLTEVEAPDLIKALDAVNEGRFQIDARMNLTMRASRPLEIPEEMVDFMQHGRVPAVPPPDIRSAEPGSVGWGVPLDVVALNDVVFEKLARDRQADLAIYVSGRHFASYSADAVIVSTPTGSTAYSFSAGGPIVSPHLDGLVFTPVAPHMVFDRSLVLGVHERIGVRVLDHSGRVVVSVDGALTGVLDPGDWAIVFAGPRRTKLVRMKDTDFVGRVRDRFRLSDAVATLAESPAPELFRPNEPLPPDLANPGPRD